MSSVPDVAPESASAPDDDCHMRDSDDHNTAHSSPALLNVGVRAVPVPILGLWEQSDNVWNIMVSLD